MKVSIRNIGITVVLALALILGIAYYISQSNKDYIGGNILHLPILQATHDDIIPSPWAHSSLTTGFLYRSLFTADKSLFDYKPDLAESYTVIDGGLGYKIKMKEGQMWSDGTPISPADFVFTVEVVQDSPRDHKPVLFAALGKIEEILVEGNEIYIRLYEPHFNFMPMLAQLPLVPKHKLKHVNISQIENYIEFWSSPVVSGMYKVKQIVQGSHIDLVPNELYNGVRPKIDEVRFYFDFESAPLDLFTTNNINDMLFYRSMRNKFTEYPTSVLFYRYLVFNMQGDDGHYNPKLQDKRIREAICYAIDNEALVKSIYFQVAGIADQVTKDPNNYLIYNPERAKQLLAEANYDFSKPLRIAHYHSDELTYSIIRFLQKNLEAVGFKVETNLVAAGELYGERDYDILYKGLASFSRMEWYNEYNSKHPFLNSLIDTDGDFDDLINQLAQAGETSVAEEIISELRQKDRDTLYKFILYLPIQVYYVNSERVQVPKGINFLNPWYISDLGFENWEIKKQ